MKPIWLSIFAFVFKVIAIFLVFFFFKNAPISQIWTHVNLTHFSLQHTGHTRRPERKKKKKKISESKHNSFEESLCLLQNYSNEKIFFLEVKRQLRSTSSVQIKKEKKECNEESDSFL